MSMQLVAGAVNGAPALINVKNAGEDLETIPFADNGVADTLDVDTDGGGIYTPGGSRVAIIGGSTAGRDHFPFPHLVLTPGSPLPKIDYPIGFNATDYCKMFYVVRKWALDLSISWTNSIGSFAGGVSLKWEPKLYPEGEPRAMVRESEIVIPKGVPFGWTYDEGYDIDGPIITDESFTGDVFGGYSVDFTYDQPLFYESSLFCRFGIEVDSDGQFSCGSLLASRPRTVGQLTLSGFTPTAPILAANLSGALGVNTCDVTISPVEYWPYATKAGLPVYDTATGAQLNDPLS